MHRCLALFLFVATLFAPALVLGQSASDLVQDGREAFEEGEFDTAITFFEAAYALDQHPVILTNLARAHEEAGNLPQARDYYVDIIAMEPGGQVEEIAVTKLQEVRDLLVEQGYESNVTFEDYVPRGNLSVVSEPDGAAVFINEEYAGVTPFEWNNLEAGDYRIYVELDDYLPVTDEITIYGSANAIQRYEMRQGTDIGSYVPPVPGTLTIISPSRGLEVYLDGEYYGLTPIEGAGLAPGRYTLSVRSIEHDDYAGEIQIESGEETVVNAKMETFGGEGGGLSRRASSNILLIGGSTIAAAGVTFGILALGAAGSYNDDPNDPGRSDHRNSARRNALLSDVMIGTGAALALVGIIIRGGSGEQDDDDSEFDLLVMTPSVSPDGFGLVMSGRF